MSLQTTIQRSLNLLSNRYDMEVPLCDVDLFEVSLVYIVTATVLQTIFSPELYSPF